MVKNYKNFFLNPIISSQQKLVIVLIAILFLFMPQRYPIDWDLNTVGFWSDIPNTYKNPDFVYPPWGLILMLPYKLIQPEGARFFSVLVIGGLILHEKWSLSKFFMLVFSPYFLVTMSKSAMDILVLVLPILLWEKAAGTRWQTIAWGLAISISLLKPQAAIFIWLYYFWRCRQNWKEFIIPLGIVALFLIPISLIGSPPLIFQWIDNLTTPSLTNSSYWSMNNFSLTRIFHWWGAITILLICALVFILLAKNKKITWTRNQSISAMFFLSMFLSPYTSSQSISSPLAFIPSWGSYLFQILCILLANYTTIFLDNLPIWILLLSITSLLLYIPQKEDIKVV
jgi:hypothetical protein